MIQSKYNAWPFKLNKNCSLTIKQDDTMAFPITRSEALRVATSILEQAEYERLPKRNEDDDETFRFDYRAVLQEIKTLQHDVAELRREYYRIRAARWTDPQRAIAELRHEIDRILDNMRGMRVVDVMHRKLRHSGADDILGQPIIAKPTASMPDWSPGHLHVGDDDDGYTD